MSSVTHFEIYGSEPGKLADFYRTLFGWQLDKAPGIDYWRIRRNRANTNSFNGGLTYRPIPEARSWVHYVNVESLDAAIEQVRASGRKGVATEDGGAENRLVCSRPRPRGKHIRHLAA